MNELKGRVSSVDKLRGSAKVSDNLRGSANAVAGKLKNETFILVTEDGLELPAVVVDEETIFTATANDIRSGTIAASTDGVVVGEKVIPAYHTTEGFAFVPNGSKFSIYLASGNRYDFTKLQAIICPYNKSTVNSVSAEIVSIDGSMYAVCSTEALATVTVDHETKTINMGIVNNSGVPYIIRYFTYKEEY